MTTQETFRAFISEPAAGKIQGTVQQVPVDFLPDHPVTIQVHYSSLNYKDALSATGRNNVTRTYPHIPGIDAAGTVITDASGTFSPGDKVIVTGNDLGTNTSGGFGGRIRVPADWVIALPPSMTLLRSMQIGTAGFTAMYGIKRLQRELIKPESGPVLVTGATGGVGSWAVYFLHALGYTVSAATRKTETHDFLSQLGADSIISSDELMDNSSRALLSREYAGAIETVGGALLDSVLRRTYAKGAVACCGNILGMDLKTNVLPFILRGISLLGIDSAFCVRQLREDIWDTLADIDFSRVPDSYHTLIGVKDLPDEIERILNGEQTGRIVITHK